MSTRTHPDLNTVAYIGIGVIHALGSLPKLMLEQMFDENGGQSGVVAEAVQHALMADFVGDLLDHHTVWDYEVAEEFGRNLVLLRARPVDILRTTLLNAGYPTVAVHSAIRQWSERQ